MTPQPVRAAGPVTLADRWYLVFRQVIRSPALGTQLGAAADGMRLRPWTELLTTGVADACRRCGWVVAAKVAGERPLPVARDEYLGMDVLAFEATGRWARPIAAFELENSSRQEMVQYALWKACLLEAPLATLFCYRRSEAAMRRLIAGMEDEVLRSLLPSKEVLVIVGTRSSAETFPDGYFRPYVWNHEARALRPLGLESRGSEQ